MDMRKYGVGTTFLLPMIVAGAADFAASGDWTPAAGDVKVLKNDGSSANISTLPTAVGNLWLFTLSNTEMEAARVDIQVVDAAGDEVEDQAYKITTYGNASAQHAFDLDTAEQSVDVAKFDTAAISTGAKAAFTVALDGGFELDDILKIAAGVAAAKTSGGGTSTITIRNLSDDADLVVAAVDANGNRTGVTVTP